MLGVTDHYIRERGLKFCSTFKMISRYFWRSEANLGSGFVLWRAGFVSEWDS